MTTEYLAASTNIKVGEHPEWHFLGLTLNSDTIISTLVASAVLVILGFVVRAKVTSGPPGGIQLFFETAIGFMREQVETLIGLRVAPFVVPLSVSLFFFILFSNWLSVLPLTVGGTELLPPPASDVNFVYPLALIVFVWRHVAGSRVHHGPGRQLVHTLKGHATFLAPFWVIEEISGLMSHSLRLFGNILAGGIMLEVIASILPVQINWALNGGWKLFDLFIGAIQAFIFSLLTIIYFSQAMETRDGH
ncbi:MAG TPA: F0F1 ATP synthase subunit A [Pseudonocardiaceae bacterium]|jgi:F-type H+-transporting ATPase subunit a